MRFLRLLSCVVLLFLTGCATNTSISNLSSANKNLQGLFGVVTDTTSESGHFTWVQNGNNFMLTLYGPLGLGATQLSENEGEYTLKTAEGKTYTADSPEDLLDQVLGWSMPISGFAYWLWGEPEPNMPFTKQGNVLTQAGWQITYSDNQQKTNKIVMLREGVRITILIDNTPN